jgi:hypothetical protein
MFNKSAPKFAYYTFDNGFGIISANKQIIYEHNQQKDLLEHPVSDTLANRLQDWGKAFLQTNFQENLDYAEKKTLIIHSLLLPKINTDLFKINRDSFPQISQMNADVFFISAISG